MPQLFTADTESLRERNSGVPEIPSPKDSPDEPQLVEVHLNHTVLATTRINWRRSDNAD